MANMVCFYLILLLHISLSFVLIQSASKGSLVTNVPGFNGTIPSKHYAGYVTVDESHGKHLYYYFVVSENKPSEDPVVLWLNGGPGCSSLDGFVYEHGPFNFVKPKTKGSLPTLELNPYSWSKVSNIIYLDSPAGVGFSYSENSSDYETGDLKTASDTHVFLQKWLELYPEFLPNPLFIAGESYAGVYVPTLADEIVQGIEADVKPKLNFKGYMVGNAVTDEVFDGNALVPFAHGMGLISDEMFEVVIRECKGKFYDPDTQNCSNSLSDVDEALSEINKYDILEPCYHGVEEKQKNNESDNKLPFSFRQLGQTDKPLPVRKRMFGRAWPLKAPVKDGIVPTWPQLSDSLSVAVPCIDDEVATSWLNNLMVRRAIHTVQKDVVSEWTMCTSQIEYDHDTGSMIKYHKNLTSKGYRALVYSGDHDMCVPFTGSQSWTKSIGYKVVDKWRPWLVNGQVAGFTQGYDNNLTFVTIKGAGHTVPEYKPEESLHFYSAFLAGSRL